MRQRPEIISPLFGAILAVAFAYVPTLFTAEPDRNTLPVMSLDVRQGIDVSYRGLYWREPWFGQVFTSLAGMRRHALARAVAATGIEPARPDRFVVRLKDAAPDFAASSRVVRTQMGIVQLVTLAAAQYAAGTIDIENVLVHELVHCLMRERMGDGLYRTVPSWVREGIAVWSAGQLEEIVRSAIAAAFLDGKQPQTVLAQWQRGQGTDDFYLTTALAFAYLEDNHGVDAIRALVGDLVQGWDASWSFARATGTPLSALDPRAAQYTSLYFEGALERSGLGDYQQAMRSYDAGGLAQAAHELAGMIRTHPESFLLPHAWYWLGRCAAELDRADLAILAMQQVLERYDRYSGLADAARVQLAALRRGGLLAHEVMVKDAAP